MSESWLDEIEARRMDAVQAQMENWDPHLRESAAWGCVGDISRLVAEVRKLSADWLAATTRIEALEALIREMERHGVMQAWTAYTGGFLGEEGFVKCACDEMMSDQDHEQHRREAALRAAEEATND